MDAYEQAAASLKYSSKVAIVLSLGDRWAVFNAQRRLIDITASLERVALLIASIESTVEVPKAPPKLTLEDLDL